MYSVAVRGRLYFASHVLSFRKYHIFGKSRGAYILKASSASWTPISLHAISMLLHSFPVMNSNPCFKRVRIHSHKALTSVVSVNETSGSQSGRFLTSYWFLSSQFHVFCFLLTSTSYFMKGNFTQILALGFILYLKGICYYHERQFSPFLRILVPVKITKPRGESGGVVVVVVG